MKKYLIIALSLMLIPSFFGCEKDEQKVVLNDNIQPNELQALSAQQYTLTMDNKDETMETFIWTKPDYGFQASISYILQADTTGGQFTKPMEIAKSDNLPEVSVTVGDFNQKMLDAGFDVDVPYSMEFRIASVINPKVDTVFSTIQTATVTAYATTFPPIYMIGDATGGWDLKLAVTMHSTAPNVYTTINEWTNGGAFRFFSAPDWNADKQWNWPYFEGGTLPDFLSAANDNDSNIRFTGTTGFYSVTVDIKGKSITMDPVTKPRMLMIGAALPGGWDNTNPTEMTWLSDGIFQATVAFTNETFRFFTSNDWTSGLNYPYFVSQSYTIDASFEDAMDGDNNFRFIGTPGTYTITLNMWDKTITMDPAK